MSGRIRLLAAVSMLLVAGVGVAATGGATATGAAEYCETVDANENVVLGGVGADTASYGSSERTVYADSTLTVVYCEGDDPAESGWLEDGDGFDSDERDDNTYRVTFTGETETVNFADHVDSDQSAAASDGLVVTVLNTDSNGEINGQYELFQTHAAETQNAAAALDNATSDLEAGTGDVGDANETLHTLRANHTDMTDARSDLLGTLKSESENGNVTGAIGTAAALDAEYKERDESVNASAEAYTRAVTAEGEGAHSTVSLSVFGSLGAGVVVGLLAGAAVPLVAARRVKEKMKLSRDVNYDRKVALLPILAGIALAVAGAAVLVFRIGADSILRVIA